MNQGPGSDLARGSGWRISGGRNRASSSLLESQTFHHTERLAFLAVAAQLCHLHPQEQPLESCFPPEKAEAPSSHLSAAWSGAESLHVDCALFLKERTGLAGKHGSLQWGPLRATLEMPRFTTWKRKCWNSRVEPNQSSYSISFKTRKLIPQVIPRVEARNRELACTWNFPDKSSISTRKIRVQGPPRMSTGTSQGCGRYPTFSITKVTE